MKLINNIRLTLFCRDDDPPEVAGLLEKTVPFDLTKEKLMVKSRTAFGFNEKPIRIRELLLEKDKHTAAFIESLKKCLSAEQKTLLIRQLESRLDDELYFYIRLDKDRLCRGEYWITDCGSCLHIRLSIAAFPKKREKAAEVVHAIFGE